MANEAMSLLQVHHRRAAVDIMDPSETTFDNMVCILWR